MTKPVAEIVAENLDPKINLHSPTLNDLWDAVERTINDAVVAFPVLVTVLGHAKDANGKPVDLRTGVMVADEMVGNVMYVQKCLPILRAELTRLSEENEQYRLRIEAIESQVEMQANDSGLWVDAHTIVESYIQNALRKLHYICERKP